MKHPAIALTALASGLVLAASAAHAKPYAVETGVKGVVDMYDLSSVQKTGKGFSIVEVATADHWPNLYGPMAFRVSRETYDCARATYDVTALKDYRRDGVLLDSARDAPHGAMRVVAGTVSSEMFNRYCASPAAAVAGLSPVAYVQKATPFAAYRYASSYLANGKS